MEEPLGCPCAASWPGIASFSSNTTSLGFYTREEQMLLHPYLFKWSLELEQAICIPRCVSFLRLTDNLIKGHLLE